jgi:phosphonate transport system ATP-binding protein
MQAGAMQGLVIKGLVKEYVPGKPVLRGINLAIAPQGITAVIGPSGTGKSTLLRCINRLVEPTAGQVLLNGQDLVPLRGRGLRMARRRIGMVFQEYNLVERLSVMENVLSGRLGYVSFWQAWMRRYPEADIARAFSGNTPRRCAFRRATSARWHCARLDAAAGIAVGG